MITNDIFVGFQLPFFFSVASCHPWLQQKEKRGVNGIYFDDTNKNKQISHQNIVFIYFFIWIPELRYEKY